MNNQTINNWENDMNEKKLREDMCEIARMMYDKKLICGPAGNISARLDNGLFLITPSIFFKQKLTPDQLIIINEMGEKVGSETPVNRDLKPTSETVMHLQSYRLRPDVMGIVHAHPSHCVALTAAGKKVRSQVLTEAMLFLGEIGVAEYAMPTSEQLGENVAVVIKKHDCVVLPYHGVIVAGRDMWDAYAKLEVMEQAAEICCLVESMGGEKPLATKHVEDIMTLRSAWGLSVPDEKANTTC
jgi:L-fuculose-phosphate aldolase|tara:strand:- start:34 stop:759 length:726 start_codon:yes stop_codon:yes gene_type:complete